MHSRREFTSLGVAAAAALFAQRASADPAQGYRPRSWHSHGTVARAGGALHYGTLGAPSAKRPVVVLHKLGGWIDDWHAVATILAADRQVIAFDLPGHGNSVWQGKPPEIQTVPETATLIGAAIKELGIDRYDLAGTSLGGCVAVAMATYYPDEIVKLALPGCVLGPASTKEEVAEKERSQAGAFTADNDPLPSDPELSRKVFGLIDYQRIGHEQNLSRKKAGRWIRPHERGVAFTNFIPFMQNTRQETLLVFGDRDSFFQKYREPALATFPRAQAITLRNASGFLIQDNPEPTATALTAFFDR